VGRPATGRELAIDPDRGLIEGVPYRPSPNADERPGGVVPDLIVLHGISLPPAEFGGPWIDALFSNTLDPTAHPSFREAAALRVSAHVLLRRDGALTQYVPFHQRAWHAGTSSYRGRPRCNDFSIGIELEGADEVPYEAVQYAVLSRLIRSLLEAYPGLSRDRIAGHADIAPGRKTDPGPAFDWHHLMRLLEEDR